MLPDPAGDIVDIRVSHMSAGLLYSASVPGPSASDTQVVERRIMREGNARIGPELLLQQCQSVVHDLEITPALQQQQWKLQRVRIGQRIDLSKARQ